MATKRTALRWLQFVSYLITATGIVFVYDAFRNMGPSEVIHFRIAPPPTLATACTVLFFGSILRGCAREGFLAGLHAARAEVRRRMPGRLRLLVYGPLLASVLLLPLGLGYAVSEILESVKESMERPEPPVPWLTMANRTGPPALVEKCLREIAPGERVLLAGSRPRQMRGFLLAYYLYPRPLYMLPGDRQEMFFEHRRAQFKVDDPAMLPFPARKAPTPAEYRAFIEKKGIDWVIVNVTDSAADATLVRAEEAFR